MGKRGLTDLARTIRRWLNRNPDERDPYARVRVPVRKGPSGRSAAVALKEPNK
ncbi:MAG: hypothetical protein JO150_03055 [Acidobacteriaceae bacterium]|nr:hypothetical protein [Acidobacteriaceae bacterium]